MKKIFIFFIFIFSIFILVWILKEPIFSYYVYKKTNMEITVGSLRLFPQEVVLTDVQLRDSNHEKALSVGKLSMRVPSFFQKEKFTMDRLEMDDVSIHLICESSLCTKNNWTVVLEEISKKNEKKKGVFIRELKITHLTFDVMPKGILGLKKDVALPEINFKNLSSQKGFPIQQLFVLMFRSVGFQDYLKGVYEKKGLLENFFSIPAEDSL
ncbi:MAG: hypothetical protein WCP39_02650 [Chlamydiota bacterium]